MKKEKRLKRNIKGTEIIMEIIMVIMIAFMFGTVLFKKNQTYESEVIIYFIIAILFLILVILKINYQCQIHKLKEYEKKVQKVQELILKK